MSSFEREPVRCAFCERTIDPGTGYVVRIEVFADPQTAPMTGEQVESVDLNATLAEVLQQIKHMSAEELQDGVHRQFDYRLCSACQRRYLVNPMGMPRRVQVGKN